VWLYWILPLPSFSAFPTASSPSVRYPDLGVAQQGVCVCHRSLGVISHGARRQNSSNFKVNASISRRFDVLRAETGRFGPPTAMDRANLQCLSPGAIQFLSIMPGFRLLFASLFKLYFSLIFACNSEVL
jgi:hypothetical protein